TPGQKLVVAGNANISQNLTVNNSVLFVDGTSGRVGIGTTSPSTRLGIVATEVTSPEGTPILTLDTTAKAGANAGPIINFSHGGQSVSFIKASSGGGNTNPYLAFGVSLDAAAPAEYIRIDENGNVGIGTSIPEANLHIWQNSLDAVLKVEGENTGADARIVINAFDSSQIDIMRDDADRWRLERVINTDDLYLRSNATAGFGKEVMFWGYNAGNVGINDTTPSDTLTVNGTMNIRPKGTSALFVNPSGKVGIGLTTPTAFLQIKGATSVSQDALALQASSANGDYISLSFLDTDGTTQRGAVRSIQGANVIQLFGGTTEVIDARDTGVFIGTGDPLNKLDVNGGVAIGTYAGVNTAPSNGLIVSGNVGIGTNAPLNTLHVNGSGAQGGFRVTNDSGTNVFFVNSSSGNVGIGITNPASNVKLQIRGSAAGNNIRFFDNGQIAVNGPANEAVFTIEGSTNSLKIVPEAYANGVVDPGGNLFTPAVQGDTIIYKSGTLGSNFLIGSVSPIPLKFVTEDVVRMTILPAPTGYVGIGTTTPDNLLTVLGNELTANAILHLNASDNFNKSVVNVLTLDHTLKSPVNSTGGIGVGILFRASNNASQMISIANITAVLYNATNGTELSALTFGTTNGTERMRIDGNGNVGIGTANPTKKLQLQVSAVDDGIRLGTVQNPGIFQAILANPNNDDTVKIGTFTANILAFYFNSAEIMRFTGVPTNVGIGDGATSPTAQLHVIQTDAADAFRVDDAASDTTPFLIDQGGNVGIGTTTPNATLDVRGSGIFSTGFVNFTNNTAFNQTLYVVNGNVGINTTSPVNRLDVNGGMAIGSYAGVNTAPTNGLIVSGPVGFGVSSLNYGSALEVGGNTAIAYSNPGTVANLDIINLATNWDSALKFFASGNTDNSEIHGITGKHLTFWTGGTRGVTSPTEKMRIESGGNVGIGTTAPSSKLHINASDDFNTSVTNILTLDHTNPNGVNLTGGIGVSILFRATDNASQLYKIGNISAILYNSTNGSQLGALTFSTSGSDTGDGSFGHLTERMRIDGNGSVGIGTTSPREKLHINKGSATAATETLTLARFEAEDTASVNARNARIEFWARGVGNTGFNTAGIAGVNSVGSGGSLAFYTADTAQPLTEIMRISHLGNVGIGQTSPNVTLGVSGRANITGYLEVGGGLNVSNGMNIISGNVGIGTTSPTDTLYVRPAVGTGIAGLTIQTLGGGADESAIAVKHSNSAGFGWRARAFDTDGSFLLDVQNGGVFINNTLNVRSSTGAVGIGLLPGPTSNAKLVVKGGVVIGSNTSSVFTDSSLDSGNLIVQGNVGIGTTAPNDALEVVGNVRVSGSLNASRVNITTALIVNNTLFVNGSNVGIGTSSPLALLDVNGVSAAGLGAVGAPGFAFRTDLDTGMFSSGANTMNFATGGAEGMRIDSGGRVAIGVSADPVTNKLHVSESSGGAISNTLRISNVDNSINSGVGIEFTHQNANDYKWRIASQATAGNPSALNPAIVFSVDNGAGSYTERARIDVNGNVGIGTTSPLAKLHINDSSASGALLITNVSGTPIFFVNGSSGVTKINGSVIVNDQALAISAAHNDFRLVLDDNTTTANLTLQKVTGNQININGVARAINTLPKLSAGSLSASTTYFIYVFYNESAGIVALEANVSGYNVTDSGRPERINASTRRLVGMARTTANTIWVSNSTDRLVISYDNRRTLGGLGVFTTSTTTTSTSYVELNSEIRVNFLTWGNEAVDFGVSGSQTADTNGEFAETSMGIDGTAPEDVFSRLTSRAATSWYAIGITLYKSGLAEGYHYATVLGEVTGGTTTGSWASGTTVGKRTSLSVNIKG
ncbi:MAG: hypothetical protein HYW23_01160, partial [Candidatus Aenigmarchaeota archaeon]|nr:hypothetical protein [Candidatus Aenigmarchaeota archaeon]